MTAFKVSGTFETRLPQLSGRWVLAYQLLWGALAVTALVVIATSLIAGHADLGVPTLRLVKTAVVLGVGLILLRRRRNDPVAALLSLAFLTWSITSDFDFSSADVVPMLADRLRFLLFVFALLLFPDGSWRPGWSRWVAATSAGVFVLGVVEGLSWLPTRLFLPLAIGCVGAAVASLVSRFRVAETEAVRQQLKWVALGLASGVAVILAARGGAALSNASPRLHELPLLWEGLFQLGIIIIATGFLVSLLRYRLFDAETAISRSAVLAVLTLTLVAIFAGTEATIENVGQTYLGMGIGNISAAMAAAVAAVLLNPLHDRISGWAEHQFQRDLLLLKRELPRILEDLACLASTRKVAQTALSRICEAVHATSGCLVVGGEKVAVKGDRAGDELPLRFEMSGPSGGSFGSLFLGCRPDGSLYGRDDLEAINHILPALRRALLNTVARENARSDDRRLRRLINLEIDHLQRRILALEAEVSRQEKVGR